MPKPARRGGAKRGRVASVDFTGVEVGGGRLLPEDTYQFELVEIEEEVGQDSGEPYLAAVFEVAEGDYKDTKAWDNFSLQPQALWKLRSFLESAGYQTEDGPMDIPYDDMVGLVGTADVIHEDYKSSKKHRINSWIIENQEQENERESRSSRSNGGAKRVRRQDDDEQQSNGEWKVKDEVTFKDGKKTLEGRIKSIDGDNVTVTVKGDGDYEMKTEDLSAP